MISGRRPNTLAWVMCQNLPTSMIISTRNTKVEMACPDVCQNLTVLVTMSSESAKAKKHCSKSLTFWNTVASPKQFASFSRRSRCKPYRLIRLSSLARNLLLAQHAHRV
jgi:hypothetical protein